jgi:hypothetical protein
MYTRMFPACMRELAQCAAPARVHNSAVARVTGRDAKYVP